MIKDLYYNNIIIYLLLLFVDWGYPPFYIGYSIHIFGKESDKLGTTKNKLLKHMRNEV